MPPGIGAASARLDRAASALYGLVARPGFRALAASFPLTRPIARRRASRLFDLCAGFVYAQVLAAIVALGIPELLAEAPRFPADLAARLGLPPASVERLLPAAAALDLLRRQRDGRFGLGALGAALVGNPGLAAMIAHHRLLYDDLRDPVALLRRGGGGGALARFWPYAGGDGDGGGSGTDMDSGPYTALMRASQPMIAAEILAAVRLGRFRHLLDVGGGSGGFLIAALRRHPRLRGTVFDLPPVAREAEAAFAAAGLQRRAAATGGDFGRDPLPGGADLVSLVRVLHDHDDVMALSLLRRARAALPTHGRLILAEPMSGTAGARASGDAYFGLYLLAMGSGRPRTPERIAALLRQAGFGRVRLLRTRTPLLVRVMLARP